MVVVAPTTELLGQSSKLVPCCGAKLLKLGSEFEFDKLVELGLEANSYSDTQGGAALLQVL